MIPDDEAIAAVRDGLLEKADGAPDRPGTRLRTHLEAGALVAEVLLACLPVVRAAVDHRHGRHPVDDPCRICLEVDILEQRLGSGSATDAPGSVVDDSGGE